MKILICSVLLFTFLKQAKCQGGIIVIPPDSDKAVSQDSVPSLPVSFTIVDFVRFDEKLHEAEFIFTFTKPFIKDRSEEVFTLGTYRSLSVIQKQILPANTTSVLAIKYRVTLKCKTFLKLYPHDSHLCTLPLGLKNGGTWMENASVVCGPLSSYNFRIKGTGDIQIPGGVRLVNLILERTSGMQVFSQMYSPLITLVSLSFFTLSKKGSFTFRIWTSLACILGLYLVSTILWEDIPRTGVVGEQTAIEHYIIICIGLAFQNVIVNILIYWYLSQGKATNREETEDLEANGDSAKQNGNMNKANIPSKIKPYEMHILKMGKCHQITYFKGLKPAKYQLPIAFLIFNIIYMVIILWITSGLPKGFQSPPESTSSPLDFSCI